MADADPISAPPLDLDFFSDLNLPFSDDFDFTLDDLDDLLNSDDVADHQVDPVRVSDYPSPDFSSSQGSGNSVSPDSILFNSNNCNDLGNCVSDGVRYEEVSNNSVPKRKNCKESSVQFPADHPVADYPSPGPASSQGSGNSGNYVSPDSILFNNNSNDSGDCVLPEVNYEELKSNNLALKRKSYEKSSILYSNNNSNDSGNCGSPEVKFEEESNKSALKRKKDKERSVFEIRDSKLPRPGLEGVSEISDEGDKKKARLIRNRESAQLSRQRKKQYVEELEDKVRSMHSTINDLNARISYIMAENASLRQQAYGVPPPGMYPPPPMGYPWAPYPTYMVKPQGSQVPLVPIPRIKPRPESAPKNKSKTKKVASVSLLGLLFFMVLFGGLVPMVNLKFSEMNKSVSSSVDYFSNGVSYDHKGGRVLTSVNGSDQSIGIVNECVTRGQNGNSSEPLVASLYVPRNDKLVKIDGNLIIHSIMASERAMASTKKGEETRLAVAQNNLPNVIPISGRNTHPHPYRAPIERQKALGGERVELMSSGDGQLQEWFMDGLAVPMLSSGMCTEVFQFDVSGAIVPATSAVNISSETQHVKNVTTIKGRNRRILPGAPLPLESNITEKPMGVDPEKSHLLGSSNSSSSMVVSVLVDPREAGDGNSDGVMGPKSLSKIFVVVLIDSVKYVTYSCMLPRIGSGAAHLTT